MASIQSILNKIASMANRTGLFSIEKSEFFGTLTDITNKVKEVNDNVNSVAKLLIWQEPVATFSDLATTYPDAVQGWAAMVTSLGYIYSYNGSAWKDTGLKSFPEDVLIQGEVATRLQSGILNERILKGDTLFIDGNSINNDGYINAVTGNISANADYKYSDYIDVISRQKLVLKNFAGSASVRKIEYYDKNKQSISFVAQNDPDIVSIVPDNAAFVRFCYQKYTSGVLNELAIVENTLLSLGNRFVAKYSPVEQQNDRHLLALSRDMQWKYCAVRSFVHVSDILTNIIEIPVWSFGGNSSFVSLKLLTTDSVYTTNPSDMEDLTNNVLEIIVSCVKDKPSILKLKSPLKIERGKIAVFAWESVGDFMTYGNTNPDTNTENKLGFLYSNSANMWGSSWSLSSGVDNLTPSFSFYLDEKFEIIKDKWKPRTSKVIARNGDFVKDANTTDSGYGYSVSRVLARNLNLKLGVDTYIEKCRFEVAIKIIQLGADGYVSIGKYVAPNDFGYAEMRITRTALELRLIGGNYEAVLFTMPLGNIAPAWDYELALSYEKDSTGCTYSVSDGANVVLKRVEKYGQADMVNEELLAMMFGEPYFATYDCSCFVKNIAFSSEYETQAPLSIYGDSFVEGSSLLPYGHENRYAAKLATTIGWDKVAIFGKGGERLSEYWLDDFIKENDWFRSQYLLIALGTNNYDMVAYKAILQAVISIAKRNGQIPVLVTVTPRPTNAAFQPLANAWIRSLGEMYVDVCKAVTVPGDERTWRSGYVFEDAVHPTVAGHQAIYDRIKFDVPELLKI